MKAYRTYLTIKDPKQVVLSNVPFAPGQQVEIVVLAREKDTVDRTRELRDLFKMTQSLPQAQALSEEDIAQEVEAYRSGQ